MTSRFRATPDQVQRVIHLHQSGVMQSAIATRLGWSLDRVNRLLIRVGRVKRRKRGQHG